jgi:hypothetical protein
LRFKMLQARRESAETDIDNSWGFGSGLY